MPVEPRALESVGFTRAEIAGLRREGRLEELGAIVALARQAHGARAKEWFVTPEPKLGGVLPATLLRDPHNGPNLVKQVLLNSLRGTIG